MKKQLILLLLPLSLLAQPTIRSNMSQFTPSLVLDFTRGTLPDGLTFTRNSVGTYFDATGTMQTAAANVPRFDYDPITHVANGILIEESRTSLILNSNFSLGSDGSTPTYWIQRGLVSGIRGTETTILGSNYMRITCSGGTLGVSDDVRQGLTGLTASATYTISFWARKISGSGNIANALGPNSASFPITSTWARYSYQSTVTSSSHSLFFGGTSGLVYDVGNVQVELGTFPTSYIPTTSAAVTRQADVCSMPVGSWVNPNEGTFFASGRSYASVGYSTRYLYVYGGSANNFLLANASNGQVLVRAVTNNVTTDIYGPTYTPNATYRIAFSYGSAKNRMYVNGTGYSASDSSVPIGLGMLYIGSQVNSTQINGTISLLSYYPRVEASPYLQSLTN